MLKTPGSPPASAPSESNRSSESPVGTPPSPKYRCMRSREKRSMPAGTGVCVVNTVRARTTWSACSGSHAVLHQHAHPLHRE